MLELSEKKTVFLSDSTIKKLVPMKKAISLMESAFSDYDNGSAIVPPRMVTSSPGKEVTLLVKPAFLTNGNNFSIKILTQAENNPKLGLPSMMGLVLLLDASTGQIVAVMEAASLTAIRTGAAGGLSARLLSRTDSSTVALYGCGVQGRTQLEALCLVRDIQKVMVMDTSTAKAISFIGEMKKVCNASFSVMKHEEELKTADIIITATSSDKPLFPVDYVTPGTHITAIGSYRPDMQELDPALLATGSLWVDEPELAPAESGDLIRAFKQGFITSSHIRGTLGELINLKKRGRENQEEITIMKSVGAGIQDLVMAQYAYDTTIKMQSIETETSKPPFPVI